MMREYTVRPRQLLLRCYAKRSGDIWLAFCLDFALGAQADTLADVQRKLEAQIHEHLHAALDDDGQARDEAQYLLTRRAPFSFWLEYWCLRLTALLRRKLFPSRLARTHLFNETLPVVVQP